MPTELKTLKDIEHKPIITECDSDMCCKDSRDDELKQEVIKWIKYKRECLDGEHRDDIDIEFQMVYKAEEWIKHFFNIKEEDLK